MRTIALDLFRHVRRRLPRGPERADYDRIVLHIGRQKSGTSVLQRTLSDSEAALAAAGVTYSKIGRKGVAHHPLAISLAHRGPADTRSGAAAGRVVAEVAEALATGTGTWLFSSEAFQNVPDPALLTGVFDPRRTDVIVYLREQYCFAQSSYAQRIHATRSTETFESYLSRREPDHEALLVRWSEHFAPRSLTVRGYSRSTLVNGDIVDDFLAAAALPAVALSRTAPSQKPLPGGPLLEFKRALNGVANLPRGFDRLAFRTFPAIAASHPDFRARPSVAADEVAAYRARFAPENANLVSAYPELREALAAGDPDPVRQLRPRRDFGRVWRAIARASPDLFDLLVDAVDARQPGEPRELSIIRKTRP